MVRVEVIPYANLDERFDKARLIEKKRIRKEIRSVSDLGNCFLIEHHGIKNKKVRI